MRKVCHGARVTFELKQSLAAGGRVEVPAGTWTGCHTLERALTLRGYGAVFDGQGRGPLFTIAAPGAEIVITGCTFTNAVALAGAAILLYEGRLVLRDCRFERCFAPTQGGGAVYARGESLLLERCVFERNTGRQGGAVLLDQLVDATLRDCRFEGNKAVRGGAVRLKEGARALLERCTFVDNEVVGAGSAGPSVEMGGTSTRSPHLEVRGSTFPGPLEHELSRADLFPGELIVET